MSLPGGDWRGALALVGRVARLLSAGLRPERTLAAVAELLREGLPAVSVAFWLREPATHGFRAIAAPGAPGVPATAERGIVDSLDALPAAGPRMVRVPLAYEQEPFGLLEADLTDGEVEPEAAREALVVVADVLGPFLTSLEISEDLAYEVALQSREIAEQRRFTSLIIDSLPLGLYVVDRQYRVQIWNRSREGGAQGIRRDAVVGRSVFEVLTRQPADQLRAEFDRVFESGEIVQAELEVAGSEGTRVYRISKIPMRLDGEAVTHVITIGEDVTDWRAIQGRILQSEKLAAIGQLAAGIMHEINNPLATISACSAALEGRLTETDELDPITAEYLEILEKEIQRCSRIVDGLLDFSRPKGKSKTPVSLSALAEDALFLLKYHPRAKKISVVRELDPGLPRALGNAEQLIQVFMALMLNAFDAMDAGGTLTVRTAAAPVGAGPGDEVVAEIADTGTGVPRGEQSKIFEPFYTTKPPGHGTGLGLSICYGIVEEHRGRIEVESHPGRGATFRVVLPVHAAVEGAANRAGIGEITRE